MLVDLLTMTGLATVSVGLWTVRVAVTAKGRKLAAAVVAAVEAIVFVVAFSRVAQGLQSPGPLVAYAIGVGLGTLLGLMLHARVARGHAQVEVVAPGNPARLLDALRDRGWPTTAITGCGLSGTVLVASITVDERRLADLLDDLGQLAPQAFWTVTPLHAARAVTLPAGLAQITHAHRP
jgi:uncharacterized protein YebE (UPF0316 family)